MTRDEQEQLRAIWSAPDVLDKQAQFVVLALLDDLRDAEARAERSQRAERAAARDEALALEEIAHLQDAVQALEAERDRLRAAMRLIGSVCRAEESLAPDPPAGT